MSAPKKVRRASVGGRAVVVLDDVIPRHHVHKLADALDRAKFRRSEYARPNTSEIRHWAVNLVDMGGDLCDAFLNVSARHVTRFYGAGRTLDRAYCNLALYGDMLFTHRDASPDENLVTSLWYICREWDVEWGGETLFFDENDDAAFVVAPRPGRLVLFDGSIRHVGRPPNRICHSARYTMAIKFARRENGEGPAKRKSRASRHA